MSHYLFPRSWSSPAQLLGLTQLTGNVFFLSLPLALRPHTFPSEKAIRPCLPECVVAICRSHRILCTGPLLTCFA